jgi:hypothetical protein
MNGAEVVLESILVLMLLTASQKRIEGMNTDFTWSGSVPRAAVLPGYGLTYDTNGAAVVWWQA